MKRLMMMVILVATVLGGCGGAPFTVAPATDSAQVSGEASTDPLLESGVGQAETVALTPDAAADSGGDAGHTGASLADAGSKTDASDAGSLTNVFPPYTDGPTALCRGPADCLSDTEWDVDGAPAETLVCFALEGVPGTGSNSPEAHLLSGYTQCRPASSVTFDGIVLCLSDLDCGGYACITQQCAVATLTYPDDAGNVTQTGVIPVAVSYCSGVGGAPTSCN